jgi:hypothetical protein
MVLQSLSALLSASRIRPDAAPLVENDDQNASPAERRGEPLTGAPAFPRRAPGS